MAVVIAIDAGTTGVRCLAVDQEGLPKAIAYQELSQHYPRPGWVEHDPEEIWTAVATTVADVRSAVDEPVAAIGITNQRETVIAWDRHTGHPLHAAIVWQDRRTAGRCDQLRAEGHLDLVRRRTGLVLDPYFSATKLEWLTRPSGPGPGLGTEPRMAVGTVDSWLLWRLTGGAAHATDPSNASRTLLFDIRRRRWDDELIELFHLSRRWLPEVRPSSGRFGETTGSLPTLPAGVPISGVAGDQAASLFGQACLHPGMTKNTYGTGSFVLMNVGEECPEPVDGLLTSVAWVLEHPATVAYALEGAFFITGAAVQWLRDGLGLITDAAQTGPLAESVADSNGLYLVPAFTGLGSPGWDPYARGTLAGITTGTSRAHLARAVVESMAYQTREVVDAMTSAGERPVSELRVDGGASAMRLLLQVQSDQLQVPVARAAEPHTTALGAAYLAGVAEGVWGSLDEVAALWREDLRLTPAVGRSAAGAGYERWRKALELARAWAPAEAP